MALLQLKLLGTFEGAFANGRLLWLANRKSWALLAYLALHPGETFGRESLAALLWGDRAEPLARRSLRQALYELRTALGDGADQMLTANSDRLGLRLNEVDAVRFEHLAASSNREDLAEAERLYRGALLDGFETGEAAFDTWLMSERARFREIARRVFEALASAQLQRREAQAALHTARRLVSLDCFDEAGHRLVMRALDACGRRNEALAHYGRVERLLREELGVAPMAETTALRDSLTWPAATAAKSSGPAWREKGLTADDKPAIAVLPFENLSGDPAQGAFARGLTEDLTTALCRMPDFLVVASHSLEGYNGNPVPPRQAADELGVRYIVTGSVQKSRGDFRISAQVVDTSTGLSLWGDRFDRSAKSRFALQDEIIANILVALEIRLASGDLAQIRGRKSIGLEALLLHRQAVYEGRNNSYDAVLKARELSLAARDLDPTWEMPWATLAWSYWFEAKQGWAASRERAIRIGVACAEKAIECNPDYPMGHTHLGNHAHLAGDRDGAIALTAKAARLGPTNQHALYFFGRALLYSGQWERGLPLCRRAIEIRPRIPSPYLSGLIYAELSVGNVKNAVPLAERIVQRKHFNPFDLVPAAATLVAADRRAEAEEVVTEILRISPTCSIGDWRTTMSEFRDRAKIDRFANLLAQAGLP